MGSWNSSLLWWGVTQVIEFIEFFEFIKFINHSHPSIMCGGDGKALFDAVKNIIEQRRTPAHDPKHSLDTFIAVFVCTEQCTCEVELGCIVRELNDHDIGPMP